MSILFSTYTRQQLLDTSTIKLQKIDSFLKNIILENPNQNIEPEFNSDSVKDETGSGKEASDTTVDTDNLDLSQLKVANSDELNDYIDIIVKNLNKVKKSEIPNDQAINIYKLLKKIHVSLFRIRSNDKDNKSLVSGLTSQCNFEKSFSQQLAQKIQQCISPTSFNAFVNFLSGNRIIIDEYCNNKINQMSELQKNFSKMMNISQNNKDVKTIFDILWNTKSPSKTATGYGEVLFTILFNDAKQTSKENGDIAFSSNSNDVQMGQVKAIRGKNYPRLDGQNVFNTGAQALSKFKEESNKIFKELSKNFEQNSDLSGKLQDYEKNYKSITTNSDDKNFNINKTDLSKNNFIRVFNLFEHMDQQIKIIDKNSSQDSFNLGKAREIFANSLKLLFKDSGDFFSDQTSENFEDEDNTGKNGDILLRNVVNSLQFKDNKFKFNSENYLKSFLKLFFWFYKTKENFKYFILASRDKFLILDTDKDSLEDFLNLIEIHDLQSFKDSRAKAPTITFNETRKNAIRR